MNSLDILNLFLSHIDKQEFDFVKNELNFKYFSSSCHAEKSLNFYEMYDLMADALPVDRKKGRYFTPRNIAKLLIDKLNFNNKATILEPAAGLGIFLFELLDLSERFSIGKAEILSNITLIEKDSSLFTALKLLLMHYIFLNKIDISLDDIDLINTDFLTMNSDKRYKIILGNPPFVDTKFLPDRLMYKSLYPFTNRNLFSMFLEKALNLTEEKGEIAFIVSESFIYLKSYNKLRSKILNSNFDISVHKLGKKAFSGANVGSIILYLKDSDNGDISITKASEKVLLKKNDLYIKDYTLPFNDFDSEILGILAKNDNLSHHINIMVGLQTNDVKRYVLTNHIVGTVPYIKRLKRRVGFWQPFYHWLLFEQLMKEKPNVIKERHLQAMGNEGIVFNNIDNDSIFVAVYKPKGYLFDIVTPCILPKDMDLYYLLAYLNSNFAKYILYKLNGTPHTNINDVIKLPYNTKYDDKVSNLANSTIKERQEGRDAIRLCNQINQLIYQQFDVSSRFVDKIEKELYEKRIIFDKTE